LFALFSGAAADRLDRRGLMVTVNTARALVLLLIFAAVTGGFLTLPLLYLTLFLLGAAETLADTAGSALIVGAVETDHLGRANARLSATLTVGNHLLGPPLGAFLFAATPEQTPDARWSSS
jgi:MFS family permease